MSQQLKSYLNNGGSVVIFPDLDAAVNSYNTFLTALGLPVIKQLNTTATQVEKIDLENPIFKTVFEEIPKNLDLPSVNRFFTFGSSQSSKEDIMQFSAGRSFLSKYDLGNGNIYLSASGLTEKDGNLARHPVFVPLMYRMALSSGMEESVYYHLGADHALSGKNISLGKNQTLKLKSASFEMIPELRQAGGKTTIYLADQIKAAGFYNLMLADSVLAVYSFNQRRSESDMHYLSTDDLGLLTDKDKFKIFDADKDAVKLISGVNQIGQTLWKLCLILSLIFIAAEILLIRFLNNNKKTI